MSFDTRDAEKKDAGFLGRLKDATPAMKTAEGILVEAIEQNFDTESAAGEAWAPLADSTIIDREKKGYGPGPILQREGTLRAGATAVREVAADGVQVGAEDDNAIAGYHASLEPRSKIPFRDMFAVGEASLEDIDAAIIAHLENE